MKQREYHGRVKTPEYASWRGMVERCENKNHRQYVDYGGRGITVCARWRVSFLAFLEDMGLRPPGMTLDRRNNKLNYCPENCCWATRIEQANNKRNNRHITSNGITQTLSQWAETTGLTRSCILSRLDRAGLSPEVALMLPVDSPRKNTRWLTCDGEKMSITDWARKLNTSRATITSRLAGGMSEQEALSLPIRARVTG